MRPLASPDRIALFVLATFLTLPLTGEEPSAVVREFFARHVSGDAQGAADLWIAGAPADDYRRRVARRHERRCMRLQSQTIERISDDGTIVETAETLMLRSRLDGAREWPETSHSRFTLRRDGAQWRIEKWESRERALAEQLAAAAGAGERSRLLDASPELQTTTLVHDLSRLAVELTNQWKPEIAGALSVIARRIAEGIGDANAISIATSARSVVGRERKGLNLATSLELAREAITFAEAGGDPDVLGRGLLRLGSVGEDMHGIPSAEPLRRAVDLAPEYEDSGIAPHVTTHLARTYEMQGELREAFRHAVLAVRYAEETSENAARISATLLLAGAYRWIGDYILAERHNRRAAGLAFEAGFDDAAAYAVRSAVRAMILRGERTAALKFLDDSIARIRNKHAAVHLLYEKSAILLDEGRVDDAEQVLNECARLTPDVPPAESAGMRAGIEEMRGNYAAALHLMKDARLPSVAVSRGVRTYRARLLYCLGRVNESRRLLEEVLAEYETEQTPAEPERLLFSGTSADTHRLLLQILVEQGERIAALHIAEQTKAQLLRTALASGMVAPKATAETGEEREAALEGRMRDLHRLLQNPGSGANLATIRQQLRNAQIDLTEFRQLRFAVNPVPMRRPPELWLEDLPAHLDGVTIVSYVVATEQTYVFVIGEKGTEGRSVSVHIIPAGERELGDRVERLGALIQQRNLRAPALAAKMYELLLAPIESSLRSAKVLCIIPDGTLWRVPFHALGPRSGALLADRMPVFYAPSIAVLAESESRREQLRERPGRALLAFANPYIAAESASLHRALDPDAPLGAIPETESEVRAIAGIYGSSSRIYIGDDAREGVLKREAPKFNILHIASHGIVHENAPMYSSLLLASAPGDREDGMLEAREIARLGLRAELAVLSACETGRAQDVNRNGVIGLSWAFLAAGCPTTVVSQWKTQSAATEQLMVEFHRHIARGVSKPEALRRAQLALRRNPRYRHPFYWAAFVVIGAP